MIPTWVVVVLGIACLAVLVVGVVVAYELGRRERGADPRLTALVPLEAVDPLAFDERQARELWEVVRAEPPTVVLPVDERTRDVRHTDAPGLYRVVCAPGDPCLRHRAHLIDPDPFVACCGCQQCPTREDTAP